MSDRAVINIATDEQIASAFERLSETGKILKHGGGDGTSSGMEARVAVLESKTDRLISDVAAVQSEIIEVKVGQATLTERVSHLPSKGYINKVVIGTGVIIAALVTFQQQIQHFLKLTP